MVVQVSRQAEMLVLNRALAAGETVTADAVSLNRRELTDLSSSFLNRREAAVGQTARRALPAGTILAAGDLVPPRLVRRGQAVTLVGRSGPLTVRADGRALADGAAGEFISVENLRSRRVLAAKVLSSQEVDVGL